MGRRVWVYLLLCGLSLAFLPAGSAGAQGVAEDQYGSSGVEVGSGRMTSLETRVEEQDAALRTRISEVSEIGADLEDAQARVEGARTRAGELHGQTRELERRISSQKKAFRESKADYEKRASAAYKGDDLEGLAALLDGWLGSGSGLTGSAGTGLVRILLEGRQELDAYEDSELMLRNTLRQISQKESDYDDAIAQEKKRTEELRRREAALDEAVARLRTDRDRTADRLQELKAAERARILRSRAATGLGETSRSYEMGVARNGIVARPVPGLPRSEYIKLYKQAAEEYGFGRDWYVLAAVGRVESDHGRNMGPSSAGAMGPMQFLPSTWEASGVDGDGDGAANIMDPRDAIPAAAGYLKEGGAPRDWYAALYSYNHADWYVTKVLAVAEAYRRLARDESVAPYI